MKFKPIVFIIGLLIFIQILFYNYAQKNNITMVNQDIKLLQGDIQQLEAEKSKLLNKFKELKTIIESIPPTLLMGFEDPETGFVQFLDYLQTPVLEEVEGNISLRDAQKFKEAPVPLHESDFTFKFNFLTTYEVEKFFNYLLLQRQYPLEVKSLTINRSGEDKVEGSLNVSLLIPAKLQIPSLSQEGESK